MFGPLFRYELTRLARRGLQPRLRAAFAGLLLVALLLAYLAAFPGVSPLRLLTHINEPLTTESASRFGERFVVAFLLIQTLVVLAVTPALVAGAIGEEKGRRSFDLLLTTALSDREIVVGKLAARLVFIGMLLLTGLPVVVLTISFGGVDPAQVAAGYALALFTMCSLGAYSLWLAAWRPTLGDALVRAYLVAGAVSVFGLMFSCFYLPAFLSPLGTLLVLLVGWPGFMSPNTPADPVSLLAWYGLVHLSLAAMLVPAAARRLRDPDPDPPPAILLALRTQPRDDDLPPVDTPAAVAVPFRLHNVPEVDDANPLGWKERHFGGWVPVNLDILFGLLALAVPAVLMVLLSTRREFAGGVATLAVFLAGVVAITAAGFRAAGSVARERQQGTLDGLLSLPVERRKIVFAKARAAAALAVWPMAVAMMAAALGVIRGGLAWPTLVGVPLVFAGWVAGVVGFGMWLSVRCRTRELAVAWLLGVGLTACVIMPLLGTIVEESIRTPPGNVPHLLSGFSPIDSLWHATPRAEQFWNTNRRDVFGCYVLAAVFVGVMGQLLYQFACREFERRAS